MQINFMSRFQKPQRIVLFVFRKSNWIYSATTGGSDSSPPTPGDNPEDEFRAWDSMLAAKNISTSDIKFALPRRNWANGSHLICINTTTLHQIQLHLVHLIFMTQHFIL